MLRPVHYSSILLIPIVGIATMWLGGPLTWAVPLLIFGFVPVVEHFLPRSHTNPTPTDETERKADPLFDAVLFAVVPLQLALLGTFLWGATHDWWGPVGLLGAFATAGSGCGALGINVAHELGHRTTRSHRIAAWMLLATTGYLHFYIEHNRGHHHRVATPHDPASARRGEVVYAFWLRSVVGGWKSAWAIEARRLRKHARPHLRLDNLMLRLTLAQVAWAGLMLSVFGWTGLMWWLAASVVGVLLLETVNYIEHYGLERQEVRSGRYERVQPHHSWNSEHVLGRVLLFDLSRHSDHHANAGRPYPILRHHDAAPELPTGYPGMVLLALVPPVFHRVMARQLERENRRLERLQAA